MELLDIYTRPDRCAVLFELLSQRPEYANISHRGMPSFDQHCAFVEGRPYAAWYFMVDNAKFVGACYLSRLDEIGVQVFDEHQKKGYGRLAVKLIMAKHGKQRYLANISPRNEGSRMLFAGLGFKRIQETYELRT